MSETMQCDEPNNMCMCAQCGFFQTTNFGKDSFYRGPLYRCSGCGLERPKPEMEVRQPVATQLGRIEQGLDKLLQSHAALEKKLEQVELRLAEGAQIHTTEIVTRQQGFADSLGTLIGELRGDVVMVIGELGALRKERLPKPRKRGKK